MENPLIEEIALGYVIKDLISHFYPNSKPKKFVEVFSGGGTGKDVAIELGITNSIHLDLINGWDALTDEIPTGADLTLEFLNNKATVDDIYEILRKSKKAKNNHHVREKIRQILNKSTNFYKEKEYWYLKLC